MVIERKLTPVRVKTGQRYRLGDGTHIEMRGTEVGRVNSFGNFAPFTPGREIIFDNKVFIPPLGSMQRKIPEVLGTHKLEMGDGYLIHGTNEEDSIGEAVSHGCVRMYNDDVDRLYKIVPIGTPVYLY
jgi:lipoprotein-anchoring transpeptidase ErfK/SrfK